ncbi:MAG: hypothetical protein ACP5I8_04000 [Phycisphaerae bacterium]
MPNLAALTPELGHLGHFGYIEVRKANLSAFWIPGPSPIVIDP